MISHLDDHDLIAFAEQAFRVGSPAQFSEVQCGNQATIIIDLDATAEFRGLSQAGFAVWLQSQPLCISNQCQIVEESDSYIPFRLLAFSVVRV